MLICPRCHQTLSQGHACLGLSRRFFFGLFAGAAALAAVPDIWGKAELLKSQALNQITTGDLLYRPNGLPLHITSRGRYGDIDRAFQFFTAPPAWSGIKAFNHHDVLNPVHIVRNPPRPSWMKGARS